MTRPYTGQTVLYYSDRATEPMPELVIEAQPGISRGGKRPLHYVHLRGRDVRYFDPDILPSDVFQTKGEQKGYCTPIPEEIDRDNQVDAALKMLRDQVAAMKGSLDRVMVQTSGKEIS